MLTSCFPYSAFYLDIYLLIGCYLHMYLYYKYKSHGEQQKISTMVELYQQNRNHYKKGTTVDTQNTKTKVVECEQ